ncbi:MAG TPA: hypothetical protein VGJ03_13470 [Acidimicrobiales bacterium]
MDPRRILIRRIVISVIVVACIAGLALAVAHTRRGDEDTTVSGSPNVVQLLVPPDGSNVLSQAQVEIDLTSLYDAHLAINAVPIPDDQLQKHPELNQVVFTPGAGKVFEKLPSGRNCVEASIFRVDGSNEQVPPVRWCFNVT